MCRAGHFERPVRRTLGPTHGMHNAGYLHDFLGFMRPPALSCRYWQIIAKNGEGPKVIPYN